MRASIISVGAWLLATSAAAQIELITTMDLEAEQVAVSGDYAFVAAASTLTVLDITNPSAARKLGQVELPDQIYGMTVGSDRAYLAVGLEGLHVFEVSNDLTSRLGNIGVYSTPGQAVDVALIGTHAVVSNLMTGLEVVDFTNLELPTLIATAETPGYQRAVTAAGDLAFVVDQPSGVHVFDVSEPTAPVVLGVHTAQQAPARSVTVNGDRAYVVYQQTGLVEVIDVENPSTPTLLGTYEVNGRPQTLAVTGMSIVIPVGADGIEIVDLSNPAAPRVTATYDTPNAAHDVAITGEHLLVADGTTLLVLRMH